MLPVTSSGTWVAVKRISPAPELEKHSRDDEFLDKFHKMIENRFDQIKGAQATTKQDKKQMKQNVVAGGTISEEMPEGLTKKKHKAWYKKQANKAASRLQRRSGRRW